MAGVEDGDPLVGAVIAGAHLEALPLHARHDVADAAPVVEAAVQELQLRRARLEGEEAERGGERGAAGCRHKSKRRITAAWRRR